MKKIFMTLAAVCFAATMNAQVYVGGSLGINAWSSQENAGDRSETTFKIMPEIGYNINDSWAIGTVIGYESNKWTGVNGISESAFSVAPYARYTFVKLNKVNFFADGGFEYNYVKVDGESANGFGLNIKAGVSVNLNDKVSFVAHIGEFGWASAKAKNAKSVQSVALGLDLTAVDFGLYFNL